MSHIIKFVTGMTATQACPQMLSASAECRRVKTLFNLPAIAALKALQAGGGAAVKFGPVTGSP